MNRFLSISVAAFIGLTTAAHATTIDVALGLTGSDLTFGGSGSYSPSVDLATTPSLVLNSNSLVVAPPISNSEFTKPTGPIFADSFLAVRGLPDPGQATFTLAGGQNLFGLTWGTIDDYNTLTLTDSRNVVYTITGTAILSNFLGSINHSSQADVIFTDAFGTIKSAVFSSTNNSFEAANLGYSAAVPLPAAFPLFAAALLGLFCLARQRSRKMA